MQVKHNMKISYAQLVSQERLMSYVYEMVTKKTNLYVYIIQQQKLVTKVHVKLTQKARLHVDIIPQQKSMTKVHVKLSEENKLARTCYPPIHISKKHNI